MAHHRLHRPRQLSTNPREHRQRHNYCKSRITGVNESGSIDGTVVIWKVSDGQQVRRLNAGGYSVFSVEFSPDGKRLVSAGSERSVRIWDADTGVELDKLPKTKIPYRFVIFSPDGKHIAAGGDSPSRLSGTAIWETSPASYERPDE